MAACLYPDLAANVFFLDRPKVPFLDWHGKTLAENGR